jgi:hypothetical protein
VELVSYEREFPTLISLLATLKVEISFSGGKEFLRRVLEVSGRGLLGCDVM